MNLSDSPYSSTTTSSLLTHDSQSIPSLSFHLTIQEKVEQVIFPHRPSLHTNLNPLSGNSLY